MAFEKWTRPASQKEAGTGIKVSIGSRGKSLTPVTRIVFSGERIADFDVADAFTACFAVHLGTGDDVGYVRIIVDSAGEFRPTSLRGGAACFLLGELPAPAPRDRLPPTWCGWRQLDDFTIEVALPWARRGIPSPATNSKPDPAKAIVEAAKARTRRGLGSY